MLHLETIDTPTLGLLKSLMQIPEFYGLYLVGGTALALQTGHRKSIDLDLFGKIVIDEYEFTLDKMLHFYQQKFPDGSEFLVMKSLTYFEDAEADQLPVMLRKTDWNKVKLRIISETKKLIESR